MRLRVLLLLAVLFALPGRAADDPARRAFDADPWRLALSLDGGFATETAATAGSGTARYGLVFDAAGGLLVLQQGSLRNDLLVSRGQLHLLGGWSLGRLELAAQLPLVLWQQSDFSPLTSQGISGPLVDPVASTTLGDLRLGAKFGILDEGRWPLGVAALVDLRLPTGNAQAFTSDGLSVVPSLIVSRRFGRVRLDGQFGYQFRGAGQYAQLVVHDAFTYGAGVSMDVSRRLKGIAEITGAWPRGENSTDRYRAPLSADLGVRGFVSPRLSVEGGVGTGLGPTGYGHERWRVFLGLRFGSPSPVAQPPPFVGPLLDHDGDGVPDAEDLCPNEPGPAALDGCPDRDGDGIPDREDKCPDKPGPAENDGCPLAADQAMIEMRNRSILLKDSILFDTGKDTIKRESFALLDQLAKLFIDHPEMKRVRVEGHTDNVGNPVYNKDLSARRAASVVRYLVSKGVAASRLQAAGFGFEQPIASNATALGRAKNRRVAFTILEESP